jgi:DNA-binding transcriptional ArsR family regulator
VDDQTTPVHHQNVLGAAALKALGHPLRVQILDLVATHGSLTASGLAELVGESSGSTSYHLRQLAKHGLIEEVPDKGTARERWWRRPEGGFTVSVQANRDDPSARIATSIVNVEFERARQNRILEFLHAADQVDDDVRKAWERASVLSTTHLRATPEQLEGLIEAWVEFERDHIDPLRGQDTPGAHPAQVHFNVIPVIDVDATSS